MPDVEFSSSDLSALAVKLDQISERLSDRERAMLVAIFQMAGDQLSKLSAGAGGGGSLESTGFVVPAKLPSLKISSPGPIPTLSSGFRDSFTKGVAAGRPGGIAAVEWDASVSVMGGGM